MIRFSGQYEVSLDSKLRFLFPAALKRQIIPEEKQNAYIIVKGNSKCAQIFLKETWDKKLEEMDDLDMNDPEVEMYQRLYLDAAEPVFLDAAGRFSIPTKTARDLNFVKDVTKDLVIKTRNTFLELWEVKDWNEYYESIKHEDMRQLELKAMAKKKNLNP